MKKTLALLTVLLLLATPVMAADTQPATDSDGSYRTGKRSDCSCCGHWRHNPENDGGQRQIWRFPGGGRCLPRQK